MKSINEKYGTKVSPKDITDWDITKFFPRLSRNQVFSPLHSEKLWEHLTPIENSQEIIQKLLKDKHRVLLVTSSHPDTISFKLNFLKKHFPFIPFRDVIITSQKQLIIGDVLIDDAPHNLINANYKGLLMDAPHNQTFNTVKHGIFRVANWKEIYNLLCEMAEEGGVNNKHY